ncbi:MAG: hypothetical protein WC838_01880 [Candidatus Margulisiibacteriota bacterium]|jgi:hypothetical protein
MTNPIDQLKPSYTASKIEAFSPASPAGSQVDVRIIFLEPRYNAVCTIVDEFDTVVCRELPSIRFNKVAHRPYSEIRQLSPQQQEQELQKINNELSQNVDKVMTMTPQGRTIGAAQKALLVKAFKTAMVKVVLQQKQYLEHLGSTQRQAILSKVDNPAGLSPAQIFNQLLKKIVGQVESELWDEKAGPLRSVGVNVLKDIKNEVSAEVVKELASIERKELLAENEQSRKKEQHTKSMFAHESENSARIIRDMIMRQADEKKAAERAAEKRHEKKIRQKRIHEEVHLAKLLEEGKVEEKLHYEKIVTDKVQLPKGLIKQESRTKTSVRAKLISALMQLLSPQVSSAKAKTSTREIESLLMALKSSTRKQSSADSEKPLLI